MVGNETLNSPCPKIYELICITSALKVLSNGTIEGVNAKIKSSGFHQIIFLTDRESKRMMMETEDKEKRNHRGELTTTPALMGLL